MQPLICHTNCSSVQNELGKIENATRQIFSEGFLGGGAAEPSALRRRKANLERQKGVNKQSSPVLRLRVAAAVAAEQENLAGFANSCRRSVNMQIPAKERDHHSP